MNDYLWCFNSSIDGCVFEVTFLIFQNCLSKKKKNSLDSKNWQKLNFKSIKIGSAFFLFNSFHKISIVITFCSIYYENDRHAINTGRQVTWRWSFPVWIDFNAWSNSRTIDWPAIHVEIRFQLTFNLIICITKRFSVFHFKFKAFNLTVVGYQTTTRLESHRICRRVRSGRTNQGRINSWSYPIKVAGHHFPFS